MAKKPSTEELILAELVELNAAVAVVVGQVDDLIELVEQLVTTPPPAVDLDELVTAVNGIADALAAMMHAMGGQYAQATEEAPNA